MTDKADVTNHYELERPIDRIRTELAALGHELDELRPEHLSGVDEFHLGGQSATHALLGSMRLTPSSRVLDVGCGIGGPARTIAAAGGCHVTGIDLTPTFVATATELSEMVGMGDRTTFQVADALALPFDDGSFDVISMIHVGMNIDDKAALFAGLARLLSVGGSLHLYDIMRIGDGPIHFPVPWATQEGTSFVASPDAYRSALEAAGLVVGEKVDRTELVRAAIESARSAPPSVNLSHLMGPEWPVMFGNLGACIAAGTLAPIEIIATRDAGSTS